MFGQDQRKWPVVDTGVVVVVTLLMMVTSSECQRQPPHILFIVADDLGWNDVGWNDPNMPTPTLNWYAHHGIILNNSYVQPLCTPSRAAFMTGMFPYHIGLQHSVLRMTSNAGLPVGLTTLPEALHSLGYVNHMVGKWHLGYCSWNYTPTYRGFDSFYGYYGGSEDHYTHVFDSGHYRGGEDHYTHVFDSGQGNRHRHTKHDSAHNISHEFHPMVGYDFRMNKDVDKTNNETYSTYAFAERAVEIVTNHDMTKPLFLYLPLQSVHSPLQVPKMYEDQYCSAITNTTRKTKCGMVAVMDEAIKNITTALDSRGFFDNMFMIFTSDNGGPVQEGGSNWPLRGSKGTLWEGGTRAAGFVYSKSLFRYPGTVHSGLVHAVDWYPTLLNMAGGDPTSPIDGINQWQVIADGEQSPRTEFIYNMDDIPSFSAAIRVGDWKLIQGSAGRWNDWYPPAGEPGEADTSATTLPQNDQESDQTVLRDDVYQLFNIKDDPTEHHDVKDENPDVFAKMKARLAELRGGMVPAQNQTTNPASDPKNYGGVWTPGWW